MLASEKGGYLTILILRLKAATPSQEKVSHSVPEKFVPLFNCFKPRFVIARCGKSGRSNQVVPCWGLSEISKAKWRLWDTLDTVATNFFRFEQCIGSSGLLNFWFVVTCLQHFHKRHCDRPDQSFLRLEVLDLLRRAIWEEQIIVLLGGYFCMHHCTKKSMYVLPRWCLFIEYSHMHDLRMV